MSKMVTILILVLLWEEAIAQQTSTLSHCSLADIENLYQNKEEDLALEQIQTCKAAYELQRDFEIEPYLRWEIRIYYAQKNTGKAMSLLTDLLDENDDLDYEQFPDKKEHFRAFFERVRIDHSPDVVFVNKFKENIDTSPAVITVYKREDIELLGARGLMDLVRITPGFAELGDGNERNLGTRGIYGTTVQHILILINGHRINDLLTSTADPSGLSLDYVQQVEFMRGPGSALYGGNAFGGVINIITKSAKTFEGGLVSLKMGSAQLFDGDWNDHQYKMNIQYGARMKNRDQLYVSGTVNYSGGSKYQFHEDNSPSEVFPDIRTTSGDTIAPSTNGTQYINRYLPGYNLIVDYYSNSFNLTANAQRNQFIIYRPDSHNLWNPKSGENQFNERKRVDSREFIAVNYSLFDRHLTNSSLDFKLSFDHFYKDFYIHRYANFDVNALDSSKARIFGNEYRWTSELEYRIKNWNWFSKKENQTIIGVQSVISDWFYSYLVATDDPDHYNYNPSTNLFQAKNSENYSALFMQRVQHLIQNKLIMTSGFRLNYHPVYSNFSQFRWGDEFSPRLSLVYLTQAKRPLIPLKLKLLYNSAFLPPPFLYRLGGISGFRGATDLQSQKIQSTELYLSGQVGPRITYNINHYINRIDNFIFREGDTYTNETSLRRMSGWEVDVKWTEDFNTPDLETKGFLSFSTARYRTSSTNANMLQTLSNIDFENSDMYYFPSYTVYAGLTGKYLYDFTRQKSISLGLSINHYGPTTIGRKLSYDENTDQWISGLFKEEVSYSPVFNLNAILAWENMDLGFSTYNLFNTSYQLPSPVARSGKMLGEKRTILLNYTYYFKKADP